MEVCSIQLPSWVEAWLHSNSKVPQPRAKPEAWMEKPQKQASPWCLSSKPLEGLGRSEDRLIVISSLGLPSHTFSKNGTLNPKSSVGSAQQAVTYSVCAPYSVWRKKENKETLLKLLMAMRCYKIYSNHANVSNASDSKNINWISQTFSKSGTENEQIKFEISIDITFDQIFQNFWLLSRGSGTRAWPPGFKREVKSIWFW